MTSGNYCIISPVRDEERYVERTLRSVAEQSVRPALWVIVDDGSTDDTPRILERFAKDRAWIRIVTRKNEGQRRVGGGVVLAFEEGYEIAAELGFDYICKLDMDLVLPTRYFETLIELMEADPRLGSVSGKAYYPAPSNVDERLDGDVISENVSDDVSVGASKFYRSACLRDIGGLVPSVMWDGIDCYKARSLGWRALSVDGPDLRFLHLRPMGSSDRNILVGRQRHGLGHWFMGSSPLFVLASAVNRLRFRPFLWGGLAILLGYGRAALSRMERLQDRELSRYIRRYQHAMLLRGRSRALARFEADGAEAWARRVRQEKGSR